MRIVDVNEFYSPTGGGVRTYLERKMTILAEMGHELIVIAPGRADGVEERIGGGRIIWVKSPPLVFDGNYRLFFHEAPIHALLDDLDPDIVETSSPWRPGWIVGNWKGRAPKVFFAHNDNVAAYPMRWFERFAAPCDVDAAFSWYTRYMARFLEKFDAFVTNGPALAKRHSARGLTVHAAVPLGIERGFFSPDLRDEGLRRSLLAQLDLPEHGQLLLGLGRHHPEKRWPMVIDAVETAGQDLPVGMIMIGQGMHSGRLENRIAGSPHIKMFRPVYDRPRLARIMASCDALIHGSDTEPFGLVGLEAIASGLPLIAPDEGGLFELADPLHAETYRARDVYSAANAIRRLFAREPAILRAAARHAASRVRSDRDHVADLLACYTALIGGEPGLFRAA
ncbi:glycosyltransferase [Stakelama sp. CBK3Z-3]|uniref:Glycosyltransferase n=1 Tax=Stakelama flava TaxID=2860338 RepID=A0ABS6XLJ2_9SPHN|nr:glycosyltransferase [Stakelama flava]MBW4331061.1 glycosyltransferase [Stakelama flava]